MTASEAAAILLAGVAAGTLNAVVGSGTLITFPTLLAFGYPPVLANVSNTVGLVPGSFSAAYGYRRELVGQRSRLLRLGVGSILGGLTGALLLLRLPPAAFKAIVPLLILIGCGLVIAQPWLVGRIQKRPARGSSDALLLLGVYAAGVYGGYFGAAQGVLLVGLMGALLDESLQRINAAKNVLAGLVNLTAAGLFLALTPVAWGPALLIALGSVVGGQLGARVGRRLPPLVLRGLIVAVGLVAVGKILLG